MTKNEKQVLHEIRRADASGALAFIVIRKSGWRYGDLWVNHLTAKSLQRKGMVKIDWPPYDDDDAYVYPTEKEQT